LLLGEISLPVEQAATYKGTGVTRFPTAIIYAEHRETFRDLGESYLDQVARKRSTAKLVQRQSNLGYGVMLVPKAA